LPARASSVTNNPIASIELPSCVELVPADYRPLLTTVSKLQIEDGLVRISALDGRNLAKFMLPERECQRLTPESGVCLEGTSVRMSYGVAESELLTEDTVLEAGAGSDELQVPDTTGR
jgi:hypothetical protein